MITLDHVGFAVADYERSKAFYERALAPLGITLLMEFSGAAAGVGRYDGPGRRPIAIAAAAVKAAHGIVPRLAAGLGGDDPASAV